MKSTRRESVHLTIDAERELERFLERTREEIVDTIEREKFIAGEEFLEITASDIRTVAARVRMARSRRHIDHVVLVTRAYMAMGLILFVVGLFYRDILDLLKSDPFSAAIAGGGLFMALFGYLLSRYYQTRYEYWRRPSASESPQGLEEAPSYFSHSRDQ